MMFGVEDFLGMVIVLKYIAARYSLVLPWRSKYAKLLDKFTIVALRARLLI